MNPFEIIAIKLLFTAQKAPADFISGLIEALNEDLANKEPDARENVNILMDKVAQLREPAELAPTAALLVELSQLWRRNEQLKDQADLVQKIADISMIDPQTPFGTRIVLERINGLANKIKSICPR